ncbi:alpha/beta hydrolase [Nannocystis bainbridge]|uniref:alpha/beta hydrolase n=1 Tax=Nannocystis bainbridge TaxID=2995303 RepID=UPI00358DD5E6
MRRVIALILLLSGCAAGRTDEAAAPGELVIGRSITIDSQVLGETRRINIYTPPGHGPEGPPLPVLYMPDGGMQEDFHHITGIVQVLTGNGTMRPFLVVGIENTERRRDLTGPTSDPEDRKIAPRVGGSAAFRRFLREELMPQIQQRHRITGETAIVGESLAGLFVMETFFVEPALFDTYVAIDPSVWWDRGALAREAAARLQQPGQPPRTLYVATSDERDMQEGVQAIVGALGQAAVPGVRWHHEPMPEERHSTIFHAAALRAFCKLFGPAAAAL